MELVKEEEEEEMQADVSLVQDPDEDVRLIGDDGEAQRLTGCVSLGDLPLPGHHSIQNLITVQSVLLLVYYWSRNDVVS